MRFTPLWPIDPATNLCTCTQTTGLYCPAPLAGKHPKHTGWPSKTREGVGQIAPYGIATGPHPLPEFRHEGPGYFALDIDVKAEKQGPAALNALCAGRALPATYTQRTPSGGVHMLYTYDPAKYNIKNATDWGCKEHGFSGLDIRGNGGMIVGAGTVGKNGVVYTHDASTPREPMPAPAWLCEALHREHVERKDVARDAFVGFGHPLQPIAVEGCWQWLTTKAKTPISGHGGDAAIWNTAIACVRFWCLSPELATFLIMRCPNALGDRTEHEVYRKCESAADESHLGDFGQELHLYQYAKSVAARPKPAPAAKIPLPPPVAPSTAWSVRGYDPPVPKGCERWTGANLAGWLERTFPSRIKFDTFTGRVVFEDGGQAFEGLDAAQGRGFTRADASRVQAYLQSVAGGSKIVGQEAIHDAVWLVANTNQFDSLYDLVHELDPDGMSEREALNAMLVQAEHNWACKPSDSMARIYAQKFIVGMIARGLGSKHYGHPVEHQIVPVLIGRQGEGKTMGLRALFPRNMFMQSTPDFRNEHEMTRQMRGCWGGELGEFSRLIQRVEDEECLKDFVTRTMDTNRRMRENEVERVERRTVFVGTTNDYTPFRRGAALRRYLPIEVRDTQIDIGRVERERLGILTAGRVLLARGYTWHLDRAEREAQNEHIAAFEAPDAVEDVLRAWYENKPANSPVTTTDGLLHVGVVLPGVRCNVHHVGRVFRAMGLHLVRAGGDRARVWRKFGVV